MLEQVIEIANSKQLFTYEQILEHETPESKDLTFQVFPFVLKPEYTKDMLETSISQLRNSEYLGYHAINDYSLEEVVSSFSSLYRGLNTGEEVILLIHPYYW